MHQEYTKWWSPTLRRDMEILVFGHAGTPILAFPSSLGRFFEWRDFGMVEALAGQLSHGHNMLFCVDSIDSESLYNYGVHPHTRIKRHQQYQQYILNEVLPFIHHRSGGDFVIVTGASFGAYHAADLAFKLPWRFGKLIAMSGKFDIRSNVDGFYNDDVYFCNPVDYLPNLGDPPQIDALRRSHIILTTAEHDPCKDPNFHLSGLLSQKSIGHTVDFENGVFGHDWPWWRHLIVKHVA